MITKHRHTWENTIGKHETDPMKYFEPESLQDLQYIVSEAAQAEMHVRAVGSGHSFSDVAITGGYLVNLKRLKYLLDLPQQQLKPGDHDTLVQVQAGMTIQKFNKQMEKKGLCVSNMGGIDNQTLAGAISTGTHGTGLELQAFHGMVRSIVMVAGDGHTYRIEPTDGITDPTLHHEEGIELVQHDGHFNSALVSLGAMGIVYSFILEPEPMFWMRETKEVTLWSEVKPKLEDRSLFETDEQGHQKYQGIMVQVSPYQKPDGDRRCVVVRHKRLKGRPHRSFGDRFRNIFTRLGGLPLFYWLAVLIVRRFPRQVPKLIDNSLGSLKDKSYENKGYKVMYQGVEYVKIRAYDCEFAFDMQNNDFLYGLDAVIERANELARQHVMYQSAPFGLRFVAGSSAYMCPDHNRTVCYIDTPFLLGTPGSDEILNQYQELMLQHNGMPHWGKIHNRVFRYPEKIRQHYTQMDQWLASRDALDPQGLFSNDFTYRLQQVSKTEMMEEV